MRTTNYLIGAALLVVTSGFAATAQAGHPHVARHSLAYGGVYVGCHAESEIVATLNLLDAAYQSYHFRPGVARSAHRVAEAALARACSRAAQREIAAALDDIDHYLACRAPEELAHAAGHLVAALRIEQRLHRPRPVHVHRHHVGHAPAGVRVGVRAGNFTFHLGTPAASSPAEAVLLGHLDAQRAALRAQRRGGSIHVGSHRTGGAGFHGGQPFGAGYLGRY